MDANQIRRWRELMGLSLTGAAEAIGISRMQFCRYQAGSHPVPRPVELACQELLRRRVAGEPLSAGYSELRGIPEPQGRRKPVRLEQIDG